MSTVEERTETAGRAPRDGCAGSSRPRSPGS